jgi:hypothetical protein
MKWWHKSVPTAADNWVVFVWVTTDLRSVGKISSCKQHGNQKHVQSTYLCLQELKQLQRNTKEKVNISGTMTGTTTQESCSNGTLLAEGLQAVRNSAYGWRGRQSIDKWTIQLVHSKGFWRWCVTLITTKLLDFVHCPFVSSCYIP